MTCRCSLALLFPPLDPNGIYDALFEVWCPRQNIEERERLHHVPYRGWAEEGWITATEGANEEHTDFSEIERKIQEVRQMFTVREMGFDKALAVDLCSRLQDTGLKVTQVRQGFSLSPIILRLEQLIRAGRMCVHGDPVATWCLSNVTLSTGTQGDFRFNKKRSREKIDAAVALANALEVALATPTSVYSTRGIVTI